MIDDLPELTDFDATTIYSKEQGLFISTLKCGFKGHGRTPLAAQFMAYNAAIIHARKEITKEHSAHWQKTLAARMVLERMRIRLGIKPRRRG